MKNGDIMPVSCLRLETPHESAAKTCLSGKNQADVTAAKLNFLTKVHMLSHTTETITLRFSLNRLVDNVQGGRACSGSKKQHEHHTKGFQSPSNSFR